jgi:GGDEF domain-containing protein
VGASPARFTGVTAMLKTRTGWIGPQALFLVPLALTPLFAAAVLLSEAKGVAGVIAAIAPALFYGGYAIQVVRRLDQRLTRRYTLLRASLARRVEEFAPDEVRLSRHYFEMRLAQEIKRSRRHHLPLCLMTISTSPEPDKAVHASQLVELTSRVLRAEDIAGRLGRRLYAIYLPHTTPAGANVVIERLQRELGESVKFGFAYLEGGHDARPEYLINLALESPVMASDSSIEAAAA